MKLKKGEIKERDEHVAAIRAAREVMDSAIITYNEGLEELRTALLEAQIAYNAVLYNAATFVEEIAQRIEDDVSSKSEKWQDSLKGEAAAAFRDEWMNIEIEPLDLELPDDLEPMEEDAAAEKLEEAPTEPEDGSGDF